MQYTWRIIITLLMVLINGMSLIYYNIHSLTAIVAYLINSAIGWLIGHQIDKYQFSKKQLGFTQKALVDYAYALNSAADAIGITNKRGQFKFVNEAHAKLYGYSKEELLTLTWKDCYSEETSDSLLQTAIPALEKYGQWRGEVTGIRKDGSTFPQEISLSAMKDSQKTICVVRNISEQKQYEKLITYMAEHNDLTNLPNRRRLLADLDAARIDHQSNETYLLFIDLDRFKIINDTLGHDMGDELLRGVAERLSAFKSDSIHVYHLGGDEFIVLIQKTAVESVASIAADLVNKIKNPYYINGMEIIITTSIGISSSSDQTDTVHDLLKMADTAMYLAKLDGKNTFKFFNKELKLQLERKARIESDLRKAISKKELFVLYQPKFNLENKEMVGMEALIRWKHPQLGLVSPTEFIPIAEETGLIIDIGKWVIEEVLQQIQKWQKQQYPLGRVSVNVSKRQFRDNELVYFIESNLEAYNVDAKHLEIEITESVMEHSEFIIPKLHVLRDMGIGIAIDDFGTGYSSLNFLKDLPIDTLKIDQAFIRDLLGSPQDISVLKTILEIGKILNLKVVAEGIETAEHLNHLIALDCPIGQGYYFSKPVDAAVLEKTFFNKILSL